MPGQPPRTGRAPRHEPRHEPRRETRRELLRTLVADLAAGRGSSLTVSGAAGIGKSALLGRLAADAAGAGCLVLRGGGLGGELPLRTLLDALVSTLPARDRTEIVGVTVDAVLRLVEQTAGPLDDKGAELVAELLALVLGQLRRRAPVLVAVDDLHLADPTSLAVWPRLVRAAGHLPLLFAAAHRPVTGLCVPAAVEISLGPLSGDESLAFAWQVLGTAPAPEVRRTLVRAGGNPGDLRMLLTGGVDAGRERTAALSPRAVEALRTAAVLGNPVDRDELGVLLGVRRADALDRLDDAVRSGVVAVEGACVEIRQPLLTDALLRELPKSLRSALHGQVARVLADRGAAAERVIGHLLLVDEPERWAARWLLDRPDFDALVVQLPEAVPVLLERLLARFDDGGELMSAVRDRLAVAHYRLGHPDAEPALRSVLARAVEPAQQANAALLLSEVLLRQGDVRAGLGALDAALLRHAGRPPWGGRLYAYKARLLLYAGRYAEVAATAWKAASLGSAHGDVSTVCSARQSLAWALTIRRDPVAGLAEASVEPEPAAAFGMLDGEAYHRLLHSRALLLSGLDRHAEAWAVLVRARELTAPDASVRSRELSSVPALVIAFARGEWGRAMDEVGALDRHGFCGWSPIEAYGTAALIEAHRGRRTAALAQLERWRGRPEPQGAARGRIGPLLMARALLAERDGDPKAAVAALAPILAPEVAHDMDLRFLWLPELVRLALLADDPGTARAAVAAAEREAGRASGAAGPVAAARRCRGLLEDDPAPLRLAAGHYREVGRPLEHAATLEDLAAALAVGGERAQARRRLSEALTGYEALGAEWDAIRAKTRLRELGVRRGQPRGARRRATHGWEALTPAEERIVRLLVEGWSNPQIAAELLLSARTVQTHVSHILAKLGLRSRGQVAGEAARHGLI